MQDYKQADELHQRAVDIYNVNPTTVSKSTLAVALCSLGNAQHRRRNLDQACLSYQEAERASKLTRGC
jgi:hypothetical protein